MVIGIPQSLIYFKRPIFFKTFFEKLNVQLIFSPQTNKEILAMGTRIADPETCYAIKVFFGHLLYLDGKCDFIFLPLLKKNEYGFEYCPKFFGLPDLAKHILRSKILTAPFSGDIKRFTYKIGKKIGKTKEEIDRAREEAILQEEKEKKHQFELFQQKMNSDLKKILIISHPYNLYDPFVNLRIKERIEKLGFLPIFLEDLPYDFLDKKAEADLPRFHWEFGEEIIKKLNFILKSGKKIDGVIELSSFACGCDAVLKEFVEKMVKSSHILFLYLILDEQTGEAGFQTRLEAFCDNL